MNRAERKELNKRAHAIRREATNADYRQMKATGETVTWCEVWDTYAAMPALAVVETLATVVEPVATVERVKTARTAPAHIRDASEAFRLARHAWETGLEAAMFGGSVNGRPARGEKYTDEERDYRATFPAPVFKDFLTQTYRDMRALQGSEMAA